MAPTRMVRPSLLFLPYWRSMMSRRMKPTTSYANIPWHPLYQRQDHSSCTLFYHPGTATAKIINTITVNLLQLHSNTWHFPPVQFTLDHHLILTMIMPPVHKHPILPLKTHGTPIQPSKEHLLEVIHITDPSRETDKRSAQWDLGWPTSTLV